MKNSKKYTDISLRLKPETVQEKTGKSLAEWFAILDEFGAKEQGHKAAAKYLREQQGVSAWWSQSLTVAYEYKHGLRTTNERKNGFEFSVQRTIAADLGSTYEAFTNEGSLNKWLSPYVNIDARVGGSFNFDDISQFTFVKIIPQKLLRLEMFTAGNKSRVDISFIEKEPNKTAIRITNSRLRSAKEVAEYRPYWTSVLSSFKKYMNV